MSPLIRRPSAISPNKSPSRLMQQMRVEVAAEGEQVALTIGNSTLRMSYEAALQLSQWLRVRGKEAKRNAGDVSRHWSALAVLDGINN